MAESTKSRNKSHTLAKQLRLEIASGKWAAGEQLPGMRSLAQRFGSNLSTIQNVIRLLEGEGLVACQLRRGAFVTGSDQRGDSPGRPKDDSLAHIGIIGTGPPSGRIDPNGWSTHIHLAAEAELMGLERFYLTRLYSVEADQDRNLESLLEQVDQFGPRMAGAILLQGGSPHFGPPLIEKLDRLGLPWVTINHPSGQVIYNFVSADNIAAGKMAGRCFLLNQFEKILILSTDLSRSLSLTEKAAGLIEAYLHAEHPISEISYVRCAGDQCFDGREGMMSYLEAHGVPQGVFASGDLLALGAMQVLREKGIGVPEEVSVIGSTGLDAARFCTPAMTVVPQPMEAMGRTAAQMLLRMIQTGERRLPGKQLKGGLVLRDSLKMTEAIRHELIKEKILTNPREAAEAAAGEVHKSREKEMV